MEPVDRLAAFLAGELSADEHAALEAELARDGALREQLAAMERADAALAALPATELPDGARDRLLSALGPALERELGTAKAGAAGDAGDTGAAGDAASTDADETADERAGGTSAAGTPRPTRAAPADELARRRRARNRRSWLVGLGGVAAAAVGVAVMGPIVGGLGGADDTADVAMMSSDAATEESPAEAGAVDDAAAAIAPVGPTLLGSGRSVDAEGVAELLTAGEVDAVVARGLTPDDARAIGASWATALGAAPDSGFGLFDDLQADRDSAADAADDGAAAELDADEDSFERLGRETEQLTPTDRARSTAEVGVADVQILGEVSDEDRAAVGRCLSTLLTPNAVLVPAFAELISFEGEPAVAFALVGDAPDGSVSRREVWVLDREGCEVRYLRQG